MAKRDQQAESTDERRRKVLELRSQGWKQSQIAELFGVQPSTVSRWLRATARPTAANPKLGQPQRLGSTKLTAEELQELLFLLAKGPGAFGLADAMWTRRSVCLLVEQSFGVRISMDGIGVILRKAGWQLNPRITRLQIYGLKKEGYQPEEIAARLGVSLTLVQQWFGANDPNPRGAKLPASKTWANSKLDAEQLQALAKLLLNPPSEYGLVAKGWTRKAICDLILQAYGVSFSINHIPHLLRRIRRMMYRVG